MLKSYLYQILNSGGWQLLSWLWNIADLENRILFARENGPVDSLTLITRFIILRVTNALSFFLNPIDKAMQLLGHGLIAVVLGMLLLIVIHGFWFIFWLLLMGSSRLWLKLPWPRPFIFIPGIFLAIISHIVLILVPDPHKNPKYNSIACEWPISLRIWKPLEEYFETNPLAKLEN